MKVDELDEFVPEAPSAHTPDRFPRVAESALHLDEFAPEALPEAPPAYASLSNGWRVTLAVGGGLVLAGLVSYFLFHS
jgi:hypothetical protein